jgi:hypothetical protein
MEVMNVPQSRSRISIAPSMLKNGRGKKSMKGKGYTTHPAEMLGNEIGKAMKGKGVMMDVAKAIGKEVAPIAIDYASDYAKKRLSGGMALPINMSPAQKRTLKKGGAITIKPEMVSDVAQQALAMLPATAKKILGALSKNKGVRMSLKQGEDVIDRMTGKGLMLDVAKGIGKEVAPILIDLASKEAKKKVSGEGIALDVAKAIGKEVAPVLIDLASKEAKKKVSGGSMRRVSMMTGCGSPYVSLPYKQVRAGGSFMPAGGGGIYPAGKYGGKFDLLQSLGDIGTKAGQPFKETVGVNPFTLGYDLGHDVIGPAIDPRRQGSGMPIQLGSPYINTNSPAMKPFIAHRGIQSYDPIGKR